MSHASDSGEQQLAEDHVRRMLAARTGLTYRKERIDVGSEWVTIDAVGRDASGTVVELVEIYARHGKLKGAQHKKPTDDAARLLVARQRFRPRPTIRLAWCSAEAIGQVERGWRGRALEAMGVEFELVLLDDDAADEVRQAQVRQYR